jgi:GT2 family glycosyltransferase
MAKTEKPAKRRGAGKIAADLPGAPMAKPGTAGIPFKRIIRGFMDPMTSGAISGWAVDVADLRAPLKLRVLIDSQNVDVIVCGMPREDAAAFHLPTDKVGFVFAIPARFVDGGRHVLQFATIDGVSVALSSPHGAPMPDYHFCLARQNQVEGVLDGVVDGLIQGWALNVDHRANTRTGGVRIMVVSAGQPVAELLADQYRADVADALDADPACGFTFSPAPALRHGRRVTLRFYAMPERLELRGSPIEISFPDDGERDRINALIARADELFSYAYHLRRELKAALPVERYMLSDYTRWAAKSAPLALARAIARYGDLPECEALVSIICPVYRPEIKDFLAAVDSVRAQSYPHWELLLVDDASEDVMLTEAMQQLAAREPRIRLFSLTKNGGISRATNVGVAAAAGRFIAFFDHDDVLDPAALEIMLRAQAATGAKLLYSDEDKIDRSGTLSEPHFKPDFNHRFLLDVNYICHFVLAEAALVRQVGELDPQFDGAQDHDFLLRVTEVLAPAQIHHVPEILYHWRKSASSTASAGGAKPFAAGAGALAVAAHLRRRGMDAQINSRGALTCYQVNWQPPAASLRKGVSILIPFRDKIELTKACVDAIRACTENVDYEIILLDNWSNDAGAEAFCVAQANTAGTRVIRIAEPFNYSRINNLGAADARYEFLLLLNNDVFVSGSAWLRTMLNELLVDDSVAAVGAKLLYPNGTVQHAGVVLGVGGIADHAFRGLPGDAPGYVMRAMAAQEISAVTAACMLVRKSAFDAVGRFDEAELTVAFNDVDLCVKLTQAGWKIIFVPDAVAEHQESISRGDDLNESKVARFMLENEVMRQRYAAVLPYDPFYNRNFSRESGVYRELRLLAVNEELMISNRIKKFQTVPR